MLYLGCKFYHHILPFSLHIIYARRYILSILKASLNNLRNNALYLA
jgi:hypothetical protein